MTIIFIDKNDKMLFTLVIILTILFVVGIYTKPNPKTLSAHFKKFIKERIQDETQPRDMLERWACRLEASAIRTMSHKRTDDYLAFNIGICTIPDSDRAFVFIGIFNAWHFLRTGRINEILQ